MKKAIIVYILFFYNVVCFGQLVLPSVISDGMILQQNSDVSIWGKSEPSRNVSIETSWNGKTFNTIAQKDSSWRIKVETPQASFTEYIIKITSGRDIKEIRNILIGEVWLCGGQSNMEMQMKGNFNEPVTHSLKDITLSTNKYLRCYTVTKESSIEPKDDTIGSWESASPNTTSEFTAAGYYFGRLLQQVLDVPVGLLSCCWGGSVIEAWMSPDAFSSFPAYILPKTIDDVKKKNQTPTVLFNGMIKPLVGYNIRGSIWYQGESNRSNYEDYPSLFQAMHTDWIKKWGIGIFPIYFCQIAPYRYSGDESGSISAFMRESQLKIAQSQENTGMAVLMDVGDSISIHPSKKQEAGERLAYLAMGKTYGYNKFLYQSPEFNSIEVKENKVEISFNYAPNGLTTFGNTLEGFQVAGKDKVFYTAKAKITKIGVEVFASNVSEPIAVRYAFKNYSKGTLFGTNGLPVSSFRSDEWDDVK